jgi:DNA-binding NarL/FixJ family response regulator
METTAKGVLIVDDHPIVRHGLGQVIEREDDLFVCGEAASCSEALEVMEQQRPQVILLDISLKDSNGIELIKALRGRGDEIPILMLSMHDESMYAERVMRAGANGYVMKERADEEVIQGLRTVLSGELYLSKEQSTRMLRHYIDGGATRNSGTPELDRLSNRELQVFEMMGQGLSTQKIADQLGLSAKTVEAHRARIKKKLEVETSTELLQKAIRWVERDQAMP